jgi:heme/copper-type cytochrome/quinol oxidase subunit 2
MKIDALLSTIILVTFLVTILMAIASYAAYKLRESRRPRAAPAPVDGDAPYFFERVLADPPTGGGEDS